MKRTLSISILTLFCWGFAYAGGGFTARMGRADTAGYYNIRLDPQAVALGAPHRFGNFRVRDTGGKEVPFFVRADDYVTGINEFIAYPLAANDARESVNVVVVDNAAKREMERFCVEVNAAEVSKSVEIRGSDDGKRWYAVKAKGPVLSSGFYKGDREYLVVDIPRGNYAYYEITLTNGQASPLEVVSVGDFRHSRLYSAMVRYDPGALERADSNKCTYLRFPDAPHDFQVSRMAFHISDGFRYRRAGHIELPGQYLPATDFELSSEQANVFVFGPLLFGPQTRIVIENQDNRPLKVDSVTLYGLNRYLCAYLEPGETYTLAIDTTGTWGAPDYDIAFFQEEINGTGRVVPMIGMSALTADQAAAPDLTDSDTRRFFEKPWFLWSVIGVVCAGLVVLCWRVVREMERNKKAQ